MAEDVATGFPRGQGELPSFSIVVPTKGRPRYLDGCLSALARQEYPRDGFEVVVVGDGSDPAAQGPVDRAAKEIRVELVRSAGSGPAAARNAGAARARGAFVAFTDDDCEPTPGWLAALAEALGREPGAAAGGRTLNGVPDNACSTVSQAVVDALQAHHNRDAEAPRFFASSNVAFPAEGFRAVGGFDESFTRAAGEDRELCARWLRAGNRLAGAPHAVVRHMRELSPGDLWHQQFGYGRGAWRFHRTEAGRGSGWPALEPGFYRALAREIRRSSATKGLPILAILALASQLANAAGVAREAMSTQSFARS